VWTGNLKEDEKRGGGWNQGSGICKEDVDIIVIMAMSMVMGRGPHLLLAVLLPESRLDVHPGLGLDIALRI
jgi:hypothetical protein